MKAIVCKAIAVWTAVCLLCCAVPMSAVLTASAADMIEPEEGNFSFLWVTDPQIYVNSYPEMLSEQNDWVLANANRLKVKYAFHTGDLVHVRATKSQWEFVSSEYKKWDDAGFSYGVLPGNHDIDGTNRASYETYFGAWRYENNWWYGGDYQNNFGHYDLRSTGGANFVFVYLGYGDHTAEDYAWVNSILEQYADRIAILSVHEYMASGEGRTERGDILFNEVVLKNPNVRMVLCGHNYNSNRTVDAIDDNGDGVADRTVYQIMANYQYATRGGNGFMRFMECDVADGTITHRTYSPHTGTFFSDYDDGSIYDQYGTRDNFVTPFDFSDPVPKQAGDPERGTVVYPSEMSFAPTDTDGTVTLPVAYQNQAETGDTYRGVGVYDRFFSLDAADAFSKPETLNYVVTEYTASTGYTIRKVVRGSSLNGDVKVPIPQNGAVIALPSDAAVSLERLTVGRRVTLDNMKDLRTPASMSATTLAVPSWNATYPLSGVNRAAGNGEWVIYDALSTDRGSHQSDLLFSFAPTGDGSFRLTAADTTLGKDKTVSVPQNGFVLAVNTAYAKPSLAASLRDRFRAGLTVTLGGHTPGVAPSYTTYDLLPSAVSKWTKDNTMVIEQRDGAQVFHNTDGLYPKADYVFAGGLTVDPTSMVLHYDYMLEQSLSTSLILNFPNGKSMTLQPYFEGATVNPKSGDADGDGVRREGKCALSAMKIPADCFNADGTVTLKSIRIYASGAANKTLNLYRLALTTDRSAVGGAVVPQNETLLTDAFAPQTAQRGTAVYDNGTLTVTSEEADGYELVLNVNRRVDIASLKNWVLDLDSTVRFDVKLLCTTSADDTHYGLESDFWPELCDARDGAFIPSGSYQTALNLKSCFTWNNVLPADGYTTVKQVKLILGGKGTLTLRALQIANTTEPVRFEDGVQTTVTTPQSTVESDRYLLENGLVQGIEGGTSVDTFLSHLRANTALTLIERGAVVTSGLVKTGMTLQSDIASWTLVVKGDVNGDGNASTIDGRTIVLAVLKVTSLNEAQMLAADFDGSGGMNTTDVRELLKASISG